MTRASPSPSPPLGPAAPLRPAGGVVVDREAEWFALARQGDRVAFGRLVQALQDRLYNAVYRMVHRPEDAMDVTQEAFANALASIGQCRGESRPYTWLFRIAMNCAISRQRKDAVRHATSIDAPSGGGHADQMSSLRDRLRGDEPTPPERMERHETVERVRVALARLAPDERAILVMRDVDGMEYGEMADVLEVPLGTLKSRLFRARMAMRSAIERMEQR